MPRAAEGAADAVCLLMSTRSAHRTCPSLAEEEGKVLVCLSAGSSLMFLSVVH